MTFVVETSGSESLLRLRRLFVEGMGKKEVAFNVLGPFKLAEPWPRLAAESMISRFDPMMGDKAKA